jgi:hypothetical protein
LYIFFKQPTLSVISTWCSLLLRFPAIETTSSWKTMANLEKLKFPALEIGGGNYIVWSLELMNNLCAEGISETVEDRQ